MLPIIVLILLVIFATRTIVLSEEAEKRVYSGAKQDRLSLQTAFSIMMMIASVVCLFTGFAEGPLVGYVLKWKTVGIIYAGMFSLFWIAVLTVRWTKTSLIMED